MEVTKTRYFHYFHKKKNGVQILLRFLKIFFFVFFLISIFHHFFTSITSTKKIGGQIYLRFFFHHFSRTGNVVVFLLPLLPLLKKREKITCTMLISQRGLALDCPLGDLLALEYLQGDLPAWSGPQTVSGVASRHFPWSASVRTPVSFAAGT